LNALWIGPSGPTNNPLCFDDKGRWKKGARMRVRSKRYQALTLNRRERERRLAAERKRSHGELAKRILGQGTTVKTEKLSYKAWQRQRYGKSLKVRAPGMFVRMLERKAATDRSEMMPPPSRELRCRCVSSGMPMPCRGGAAIAGRLTQRVEMS
jgi:putative transposase